MTSKGGRLLAAVAEEATASAEAEVLHNLCRIRNTLEVAARTVRLILLALLVAKERLQLAEAGAKNRIQVIRLARLAVAVAVALRIVRSVFAMIVLTWLQWLPPPLQPRLQPLLQPLLQQTLQPQLQEQQQSLW